jgi:hypothetical protein
MSALDDAIRELERAVARLAAAADRQRRSAADAQTTATAAALAGRIDAALAKLDRLLEPEG